MSQHARYIANKIKRSKAATIDGLVRSVARMDIQKRITVVAASEVIGIAITEIENSGMPIIDEFDAFYDCVRAIQEGTYLRYVEEKNKQAEASSLLAKITKNTTHTQDAQVELNISLARLIGFWMNGGENELSYSLIYVMEVFNALQGVGDSHPSGEARVINLYKTALVNRIAMIA